MFVNNLSNGMGLDKRSFKVTNIREGSVIVDYEILIDENMPTKSEIGKRQEQLFKEGKVDLGAPIMQKNAPEPE